MRHAKTTTITQPQELQFIMLLQSEITSSHKNPNYVVNLKNKSAKLHLRINIWTNVLGQLRDKVYRESRPWSKWTEHTHTQSWKEACLSFYTFHCFFGHLSLWFYYSSWKRRRQLLGWEEANQIQNDLTDVFHNY